MSIGVVVSNVTKVAHLYSVSFSIQNIDFVAAYDLSSQTILGASLLMQNKNKIQISSFVLNLSNPNDQDVVFFSKDPKAFVSQRDPIVAKRLLE